MKKLERDDTDYSHEYYESSEVDKCIADLEAKLLDAKQPPQPITADMLDDDEWTDIWIECSDENGTGTEIEMSLFAEKVQKAFCEKNGIKHRGDTT